MDETRRSVIRWLITSAVAWAFGPALGRCQQTKIIHSEMPSMTEDRLFIPKGYRVVSVNYDNGITSDGRTRIVASIAIEQIANV